MRNELNCGRTRMEKIQDDAMTTYSPTVSWTTNKEATKQAVAGLCLSARFDTAAMSAIEVLTELITSYMITICTQTRNNCDLAGRTIPIASDVWLTLVNLGLNVEKLPVYLNERHKRRNNIKSSLKLTTLEKGEEKSLIVGKSRSRPQYVYDFLPPFPDPHTYIRTEIITEPNATYRNVREITAKIKKETQQSLVDFMLRMHPRTSLFHIYEEKILADIKLTISKLHEKQNEEDFSCNNDETETSLLWKKLPASYYILNPSFESRPYLSALICDEFNEENRHNNHVEELQSDNDLINNNLYLRAPRMPTKGNFILL